MFDLKRIKSGLYSIPSGTAVTRVHVYTCTLLPHRIYAWEQESFMVQSMTFLGLPFGIENFDSRVSIIAKTVS